MTFNISGNVVITNDRLVNNISGAAGSRPASPITGQLFFNTTSSELEVWNGSAWKGKTSSGGGGSIPQLWTFGLAGSGALGDNSTVNKSSPVSVVGGFTDWVQASPGPYGAAALRANGTVWTWGTGYDGRLGDDSTVNKSSPVSVVGGFTDWVQVSSGLAHVAAIRANGTAWAWGNANTGRLGDNSNVSKSSPVSVVGGFTDWVQVAAGSYHTMGIRANGTAWGWGRNNLYGQIGDNTRTTRSSPVSVVGGFTDWVQVAAGRGSTTAIRANGTAWSWGGGPRGVLGVGDNTRRQSPTSVVGGFTDWVQVSSSSFWNTVTAIRANGTAWAWGSNYFGQLGDNTAGLFTSKSSPVSVVGGFTDWVQIASGFYATTAIRANGTAWAWGDDSNGGLGDNSNVNKSSPVSVVGGFTDWVQINTRARLSTALRSTVPR